MILKVPPQELPFSTEESIAKFSVITKGDLNRPIILYYYAKFKLVRLRSGMQVCMAKVSSFEARFGLANIKNSTLSIETRHWF